MFALTASWMYKYCVFIQMFCAGGDVFKKMEIGKQLPDNGRVLITCKNGQVTALRKIYDDEHVASLKSLLELAEQAGCVVVQRGKTKI